MSEPEHYVYEDYKGNRASRLVRPRNQRPRAYSIGDRVGSWVVLEYAGISERWSSTTMYLCRCDCGTEVLIPTNNLRAGLSTRCRTCADKSRRPRRTDPHVCRWCGKDYTTQARRNPNSPGMAEQCAGCYARAGRNGRAPCGYPIRRRAGRPATDHTCEECAE
jgi:hypothetical protein